MVTCVVDWIEMLHRPDAVWKCGAYVRSLSRPKKHGVAENGTHWPGN